MSVATGEPPWAQPCFRSCCPPQGVTRAGGVCGYPAPQLLPDCSHRVRMKPRNQCGLRLSHTVQQEHSGFHILTTTQGDSRSTWSHFAGEKNKAPISEAP